MRFVCISAAYSVLFLILALLGATGPSSVLSDIDKQCLPIFHKNLGIPPPPPYLGIIPKKTFLFRSEMAKRQRCNICNISAIFRPVALWWVEYFVALTQFGRYKRQNRHMIYTPCSDVWNYRWKWSWGVVISYCDFLFNVAKFYEKKFISPKFTNFSDILK